MKQKAIICDLDGTLAEISHRQHYVRTKPKNWKAFHEGMTEDKLEVWCAELLKGMKLAQYKILLLTGRDEPYRQKTLDWLKQHHIEFDQLFMRPAQDFRLDTEVKKEIYERDIAPFYEVLFVVEDRKKVVEMWRENSVTCLQCAEGDY